MTYDIEELKNTIYNADCLDLMPHIKSKSIDMILCDLPYNTTACHWDKLIPFEPLWEQYKRIIKDNGAIVLTASQPFTSALVMSNIKMFKYEWIWEKNKATGHLDSKKKPMKAHENVLVFYSSLPKYNPQGLIEKDTPTVSKGNRGIKGVGSSGECYGLATKDALQTHTNYPRSVQKISVDMKAEFHPTQKPVALFEYLIRTYSNEGDLVLDNCAGSFTTAIASENLKRNWICIEKEAEYCAIGEKRIKENRERLHNIDIIKKRLL
jgi:site-specific DNA-methyltransferase (adenine-specific)